MAVLVAFRWRKFARLVFACTVALLFTLCAFTANADEAPVAERPARTLHFPADQTVGTISGRAANDKPLVHAMYGDEWKPLGNARGDVSIPANTDVRLDVGQAASADLASLDALAPNDLQAINLRDTDVKDDGLAHVGRLTGLRAIDLQSTHVTDEGIKHLARLAKLEQIDLDAFRVDREGFGVGDDAMKVLGQLPSLRSVGLRLTKVTDAGLAELAKCPTLTYLGLAGTRVTDAGLASLEQLSNLDSLQLGVYNEGAKITDDGLKIIGKLKNLKSLDLSGTKVSDKGLVYLAPLVKLEHLALDHTDVSDKGLAQLEPRQSLKTIRLYTRHSMGDVAAENLAKLKSLERISENLEVTDKGIAALATLPKLQQLTLHGEGVTDASAKSIAGMKSLTWLWLQNCPISDETLAAIGELANLEILFLTKTKVTGDGFKHLAKLPNLRILDIDVGTRAEHAEGARFHLREIGKLMQLKDLRIQGGELTSADVQYLLGLLALEKLTLKLPLDDDGAFNIAGFDRLKSLNIIDAVITDAGLEQLSLLRNLEFAQITGHFTDRGLLKLAPLKSLRRLYVGSPYVTDEGRTALAKAMPALQHVLPNHVPGLSHGDITITDKDTIRREGDAKKRATLDALEDQPPPALTVTNWINADAAGLDPAKFAGKVVVLDFWGTWCGPCRAFTPRLKELHEKYASEGLVLMGIHTTNGANEMPEYIAEQRITWPQAVDVEKTTVSAWKVPHYPSLYVIDRWGKIRYANPYRGDVERAIVQLLQETAPPSARAGG